MRVLIVLALTFSPMAAAAAPLPVIDMHLHAFAADEQGPPPVAVCAPLGMFGAWDQGEDYGTAFLRRLKQPPCSNPVGLPSVTTLSCASPLPRWRGTMWSEC